MSEELKDMKKRLTSVVMSKINGNLEEVDAKELGEVIDMIKDLSEAIVNCDIAESMEDASDEEKKHYTQKYLPEYTSQRYFQPIYYNEQMRDLDRTARNRMYFTNPNDMGHDSRDGKSYISRRYYIEAKESGSDGMTEMEKYIHDLGEDLTELIEDMSPNQKAILKQKIAGIANRIA